MWELVCRSCPTCPANMCVRTKVDSLLVPCLLNCVREKFEPVPFHLSEATRHQIRRAGLWLSCAYIGTLKSRVATSRCLCWNIGSSELRSVGFQSLGGSIYRSWGSNANYKIKACSWKTGSLYKTRKNRGMKRKEKENKWRLEMFLEKEWWSLSAQIFFSVEKWHCLDEVSLLHYKWFLGAGFFYWCQY